MGLPPMAPHPGPPSYPGQAVGGAPPVHGGYSYPGGPPTFGPGYVPGYAPPPSKKMPTWAIVLICAVGGLFVLVLVAIAVPTFLNVQGSASDRATQENLETAFAATRSEYGSVTPNSFAGVTTTSLAQLEPSFSWVGGATPAPDESTISVAFSGQSAALATRASGGSCWYLVATVIPAPSGTAGGERVSYATARGTPCAAGDLPTTGWQTGGFPSS